ncbi:hypothetical protein I4U23_024761 [Adineta vaga]|nr:hypothetical protein I4U23_024761 [Adineta vaga]
MSINRTNTSNVFIQPTLVWCLIMPLIHFLSLISNILCIVIFSSKTFVHKPIAIYFICLLISDSTTLLIGYSEMLDRESFMMDKSSFLCAFNKKIIHNLTEFIYSFMGKFCLEWMLYKVLWTRASTILLAILSIQRSRTFFSLSYRESRFCALFACLMSILIASLITCFEWIGIQCDKSTDSYVYTDVYQLIMNQKISKQFYTNFLCNHYNESIGKYYCMIQSLEIYPSKNTITISNQSDCSMTRLTSEFYSLTQSLLSNGNNTIADHMNNILANAYNINYHQYSRNTSGLQKHIEQAGSSEIITKLFEKRSCHLTLTYSVCLKLFNFLHSLSFGFNRHTIAIFFGNALPSFIVFLANLLSLKVIYFSKSLKYLKKTTQKNRRKRRLQNDLRAFLVILIESFSVITISWGIPIFLTVYHCQTLYVVSIAACPQIKKSLVFFLFPDLFNSSTNCLLYSLSGKLFRRKFIFIIKGIFTCGRGVFWGAKQRSLLLPRSNLELQASNEPSTAYNNGGVYSKLDTYRHSGLFLPSQSTKLNNISKAKKKILQDDGSSCMVKMSDDQDGSNETQVEFIRLTDRLKRPQKLRTFLIDKVQFFDSHRSKKAQTVQQKRRLRMKSSLSSSSAAGSMENNSIRQQSNQQRHPTQIIAISTIDKQPETNDCVCQNVTCL